MRCFLRIKMLIVNQREKKQVWEEKGAEHMDYHSIKPPQQSPGESSGGCSLMCPVSRVRLMQLYLAQPECELSRKSMTLDKVVLCC